MKDKKINFKEEILSRCKIINSVSPEILSAIAPKNNCIPNVMIILEDFDGSLVSRPDADDAIIYLYDLLAVRSDDIPKEIRSDNMSARFFQDAVRETILETAQNLLTQTSEDSNKPFETSEMQSELDKVDCDPMQIDYNTSI